MAARGRDKVYKPKKVVKPAIKPYTPPKPKASPKPPVTTAARSGYSQYRVAQPTPPPYDKRRAAVAEQQAAQPPPPPIPQYYRNVAQPNITGYRMRGGKGYQGTGTQIPITTPRYYPSRVPTPTNYNQSLRTTYDANGNLVVIKDEGITEWANKVFSTPEFSNFLSRWEGLRGQTPSTPSATTGTRIKSNVREPALMETGVRTPMPDRGLLYNYPSDTGSVPEEIPGGGGGGGGGGYTYPEYTYPTYPSQTYSSPFAEYQRGYARQGTATPAMPQFRTAGQGQQGGYNNQQTVYPARWQQLLTSWRI